MHLLVLSAFRPAGHRPVRCAVSPGLNAPSGAQCFPTKELSVCLVITSERLNAPSGAQCFPTTKRLETSPIEEDMSQCTFWCSVLSDREKSRERSDRDRRSQCTFWCSVLSDIVGRRRRISDRRLNAPSGAQCFPTPPPENRATTPFTGTKSPPTWKAPHRIGPHLSN